MAAVHSQPLATLPPGNAIVPDCPVVSFVHTNPDVKFPPARPRRVWVCASTSKPEAGSSNTIASAATGANSVVALAAVEFPDDPAAFVARRIYE